MNFVGQNDAGDGEDQDEEGLGLHLEMCSVFHFSLGSLALLSPL